MSKRLPIWHSIAVLWPLLDIVPERLKRYLLALTDAHSPAPAQ